MPVPRVISDTLTDDVTLSIDFMLPGIHDQVKDATPMLSWFLGTLGQEIRKVTNRPAPGVGGTLKKLYPGGPSIDVTVKISKGQASTEIVGLQKVPAVTEQLLTLARNPVAYIGRTLVISNEEIRKASHTTAAKADLVQSRVDNFKQAQVEKLDAGLSGVGGSTTNAIRGFGDVFANSTYAELDPTIYPTWAANLNAAPGSFALNGEKLMNEMINNLTIDGSRPSVIMMDAGMISRFDQNISSRVFFASGPVAHMGFITRTFQQIPIVMNKTMPADTIWYLNDDFAYLYVHQDSDNRISQPAQLQDSFGVARQIEWMGQLVVKSRRHFGEQSSWTN